MASLAFTSAPRSISQRAASRRLAAVARSSAVRPARVALVDRGAGGSQALQLGQVAPGGGLEPGRGGVRRAGMRQIGRQQRSDHQGAQPQGIAAVHRGGPRSVRASPVTMLEMPAQ